VLFILYVVGLVLHKIIEKCTCCKKLYDSTRKEFIWQGLINLIEETYLIVVVAVMLQAIGFR